MNAVERALPLGRLLALAHDVVAFAILALAIVEFAKLPQFPRVALLYFVPPVIAVLFTLFNTNKDFAAMQYGCRLFLAMIASSVVLGELPFVLPNLKPQFPGMPLQQDRVLVFYFAAYMFFIGGVVPGYVLGLGLYRELKGLPRLLASPILYLGWATWLAGIVTVAVAMTFHNRLF